MQIMVDAILFDLGDTLLDFQASGGERQLFRSAGEKTHAYLKQRGCNLPPVKKYYNASFRTLQWAIIWSFITRREVDGLKLLTNYCIKHGWPSDPATVAELCWLWYEPIVSRSKVEPDVIPTLATLRDAGIKLALVSNTCVPGHILDRHLQLESLLEFFPIRVYSSDIGVRKPHPRIFQAALDQLNITPQQAVFVGDMVKTDIIGARRLGMKTILRQSPRRQKSHLADLLIQRISEIPTLLLPQKQTAEAK